MKMKQIAEKIKKISGISNLLQFENKYLYKIGKLKLPGPI